MRTRGVLIVMAVCAATAGCSEFLRSTVRNFTEWPILSGDEARMKYRNHRRAVEAWHYLTEESQKEYSDDFGAGFVAGYADYLTYGGNGDPPAVPPFCYRTVKYQTPEGVEAINQWYSGWRHGAMMAKASGMRELELIPLSAPPINAVERDNGEPIALPSTPEKLPLLPGQLPPPHPLPPPAPLK